MGSPVATHPLAPDWLALPADANDLGDGLFSANTERDQYGQIQVAGVTAGELVETFGTPLYVVDEADARARAARTLGAFRSAVAARAASGARAEAAADAPAGSTDTPRVPGVTIYYAAKAFLSAEVARWMIEEGLNIDVCSGGELAVALAAGAPAARLGFHGNNKSLAEIERAVAAGIGTIVLDSLEEIERVAEASARHGRRQGVRLRVNSGVHAHTHEFLATSHEDQKFGLPLTDTAAAVAQIRSHESLDFRGLHCHIGSQIFDASGFGESAARLLIAHRELLEGGPVPELNLGGGFGIAYTTADDPQPIEQIAEGIAEAVFRAAADLGVEVPNLAFEPGRSIIGPAGMTLYTVGTRKDVHVAGEDGSSSVRRYLSVDGGMSDNARPSLYGADYSVRLANRVSDAPAALVRLAGKHCESGDIVVNADYLPGDAASGDIVAVPATGAYCWSLASNYNYLGRPAVVAVVDGTARVIVRGETEAELLARDAGLDAR
ncbi:diaminopimelate decarboxylase [Leifsonia sp. ALI-44-B]|nr:diaminopimelate decarboxylase [Leifsonia sp. ALI-44-B]